MTLSEIVDLSAQQRTFICPRRTPNRQAQLAEGSSSSIENSQSRQQLKRRYSTHREFLVCGCLLQHGEGDATHVALQLCSSNR